MRDRLGLRETVALRIPCTDMELALGANDSFKDHHKAVHVELGVVSARRMLRKDHEIANDRKPKRASVDRQPPKIAIFRKEVVEMTAMPGHFVFARIVAR